MIHWNWKFLLRKGAISGTTKLLAFFPSPSRAHFLPFLFGFITNLDLENKRAEDLFIVIYSPAPRKLLNECAKGSTKEICSIFVISGKWSARVCNSLQLLTLSLWDMPHGWCDTVNEGAKGQRVKLANGSFVPGFLIDGSKFAVVIEGEENQFAAMINLRQRQQLARCSQLEKPGENDFPQLRT